MLYCMLEIPYHLHVAIIDDNPASLGSLTSVVNSLESHNKQFLFNAGGFKSSEDLLYSMEEEGYDPAVLFLDVKLPGIDGLELAAQVRSANPHCQIVFVSALMEHELDEFYKTLGNSFVYYQKPMMFFEIISAVNVAAAAWKSSIANERLVFWCTHPTSGLLLLEEWAQFIQMANISAPIVADQLSKPLSELFSTVGCAALLKMHAPLEKISDRTHVDVLWHKFSAEIEAKLLFLNSLEQSRKLLPAKQKLAKSTSDYLTFEDKTYTIAFIPEGKFSRADAESVRLFHALILSNLQNQD